MTIIRTLSKKNVAIVGAFHKEEFGLSNISKLRKDLKLTQKEAEEAMKVSDGYLNIFENRKTQYSFSTVIRYLIALGYTDIRFNFQFGKMVHDLFPNDFKMENIFHLRRKVFKTASELGRRANLSQTGICRLESAIPKIKTYEDVLEHGGFRMVNLEKYLAILGITLIIEVRV